MKKGWIDGHTHLNDVTFIEDFDDILKRLKEHNIVRVNLVGVELQDAKRALRLVDDYDVFDCSIGLHPSHVKDYTKETILAFEKWADDERVVCIGEIGLDYYWHQDNVDHQKQVFISQIQLANRVKKPVMIHSRDAMEDTIDVLIKYRPEYGCVMHSFSGTLKQAQKCVDLGFMISVGGPITFKNGQQVREVVSSVPLKNLLIETDAPYLTPHPYRGKRNESSYVRFVGEKLAELKGISIEKAQGVLLDNYMRVFHRK